MGDKILTTRVDQRQVTTPSIVTDRFTLGDHIATGVYGISTAKPTSDMLVSKGAFDMLKRELVNGSLDTMNGGITSDSSSLISPPLADPYFGTLGEWNTRDWDISSNEAVYLGSTNSIVNKLGFDISILKTQGRYLLFINVSELTTGELRLYDDMDQLVETITAPGIYTVMVQIKLDIIAGYYLRAIGVYPEDKIKVNAFAICYLYERLNQYMNWSIRHIIANDESLREYFPKPEVATRTRSGTIIPGNTLKITNENTCSVDVDVDYLPSASDEQRGLVSIGSGIVVDENGTISVTTESVGSYVPIPATETTMGIVSIVNPRDIVHPTASPAGYGCGGETLAVLSENIDITLMTGNYIALSTLPGTKPFGDNVTIFNLYRSKDDSIRYQIGINPLNGSRAERLRNNGFWEPWRIPITMDEHNNDPWAHGGKLNTIDLAIGDFYDYSRAYAPSGWMVCDGVILENADVDYPEFYEWCENSADKSRLCSFEEYDSIISGSIILNLGGTTMIGFDPVNKRIRLPMILSDANTTGRLVCIYTGVTKTNQG